MTLPPEEFLKRRPRHHHQRLGPIFDQEEEVVGPQPLLHRLPAGGLLAGLYLPPTRQPTDNTGTDDDVEVSFPPLGRPGEGHLLAGDSHVK